MSNETQTPAELKQVYLICEMLTDVLRGIYTQWIHYTDGTVETVQVPKGPIIFPLEIL